MFRHCHDAARRRGLTFLELVIAMAIMVMVVGTLGTLAQAVHDSFEYSEGHGLATQHARVVLDRISRMAAGATASEQFPGLLVVAGQVGTTTLPEMLVIWHPTGAAVDPAGLPRFNELVIYCPSPTSPNQLLEITVPGDTRTAPAASNLTSWAQELAAIKTNPAASQIVLTNLVRSCLLSTSSGSWRSAVRFETRLRPSDSQWAQYKAGTLAWKNLPWSQGIYGSQMGMRQVWLRVELQMMPGSGILGENTAQQQPIPFFASAALYYSLHK